MNIFSHELWNDFLHDPREALNKLTNHKSVFIIHPVRLLIFIRVVLAEYLQNNCFTRGSALAYALLLTLIPLVASAAFMIASFSEIEAHQVVKLFTFILPFAPPAVLEHLGSFFVNAQKLKGLGIGVLIIVTVGLFGTVEDSLNTIWKVSNSRSFFVRLRTFTMVMVYSPILFIASFQFRRTFQINFPDLPIITAAVPYILIVFGFFSLFFFVPNTKVKFRSALIGGLVAGILFEFERHGFGTYMQLSLQTQTIYGVFGILSFFLISLFLVGLIILLGAEIAYVHQNFYPLLRSRKKWDRRVGDYKVYILFRMMFDVVYAFIKKLPPPTIASICEKYELTETQAQGLIKWLIHEGYLHNISNKDAFVPARDFTHTPIRVVLDAIEDQHRRIPSAPNDYTKIFLSGILTKKKKQSVFPDDSCTFISIINDIDIAESQGNRLGESLLR
jgi:membrane protein